MAKYSTMEGDSNIAKFLPLQILVVGYLTLTLLYIVTVTGLPAEWDLQYIHGALGNHPFLTDILKGFLALSAVAIAWQRSMATEHQIKLQTNSNRISAYYDTSNHLKESLNNIFPLDISKEDDGSILNCRIIISDPNRLFRAIFQDPLNGDYSPNVRIEKLISNYLNSYYEYMISSSDSLPLQSVSIALLAEHGMIIVFNDKSTKQEFLIADQVLNAFRYIFDSISGLPIDPENKYSFIDIFNRSTEKLGHMKGNYNSSRN